MGRTLDAVSGEMSAESRQAEPNGLPEGWVRATLGEVCIINPRHQKGVLADSDLVSFVPMADVDHITGTICGKQTRPYGQVRKGFTHFADGDVLFARITPCMENGKVAVARGLANGLGCGTTEFHVLRPLEGIRPDYVYHYLRQESFRRAAGANMSGTAGQLRVPTEYIKSVELPLPPLPEQRRIVAKIEALFEESRTAREALDRIPPLLKKFRQSVLAAAFRGDLTREWREQNAKIESAGAVLGRLSKVPVPFKKRRAGHLWGAGVVPGLTEEERYRLPESWTWAKVADLGETPDEAVQVGPMSMRSRDFEASGVPVLNVGCVQWGAVEESKLNYMSPEKATAFERYRIEPGDILFTRSGTIGRCAVAGQSHSGYLMTFHLLRVRPDTRKCVSEYVRLVFQWAPHIRRQMDEAAIGSTRAGFNTRLLAGLDLPLPPVDEQREIIRRIEALFALAETVERCSAEAVARAEQLTQAILANAFRGELVPREPNDEPAFALLDRSRALKR